MHMIYMLIIARYAFLASLFADRVEQFINQHYECEMNASTFS